MGSDPDVGRGARHAEHVVVMPKLDGVLETSLYVDDLERAARFYGDVLGLKELVSDARFRAYDVGGKSVLLIFRRGFEKSCGPGYLRRERKGDTGYRK